MQQPCSHRLELRFASPIAIFTTTARDSGAAGGRWHLPETNEKAGTAGGGSLRAKCGDHTTVIRLLNWRCPADFSPVLYARVSAGVRDTEQHRRNQTPAQSQAQSRRQAELPAALENRRKPRTNWREGDPLVCDQ